VARPTRRTSFAVATLALFGATFFWRILAREDVRDYGLASADLFLYYYPTYEQMYGRVLAGALPRWNPWQLSGTPWLAALQAGLYYPGHLLYLLLPTRLAMASSGIAHLLVASIGTFLFTRRAGLGHLGAFAAALAFGFRGGIVFTLNGPNLQEAAAWIGVGALGAILIAERRNARAVAALAAATALSLLAGYPQHSLYLLYTWASLWLVWVAAAAPARSPRNALASGACFACALLLGAVIASAQLLPTAELVRDATRDAAALPADAVTPFGTPAAGVLLEKPVVGHALSYGILVLALAGVATITGRHRALALWALGLATLAALFSFGPRTGWFSLLRALPGMAMFRGPERILLLVDFGVAVAAGVAVDALVRRGARAHRSPFRMLLDVAPALAAAALVLWHVRRGTPSAPAVAAGMAIVLAATLVRVPARAAVAFGVAALGLLGAELLVRSDLRLVFPYARERVAWFESYDAAYEELARDATHQRTWVVRALDPPLALKHATRHRFRSIEDYEPVNLHRQSQYLTFLGEGVVTDFVDDLPFIGAIPRGLRRGASGSSPGLRRRLLDQAGVSRIVMSMDTAARPAAKEFLAAADLTAARRVGPFVVADNPHALPRAWVVHRAAPAPPAERLLPLLAHPSFDPLALAYVEGDPGFVAAADAPARGEPVRFVADGEDVVEIETAATAPGLLVLADTFAPGWHATVDGAPVPILATNHLFRGVPVPAGTHRVRFTYGPTSIPAGQALSVVGVAILAWLARARRPTGERHA
jgi:hypothetical protein